MIIIRLMYRGKSLYSIMSRQVYVNSVKGNLTLDFSFVTGKKVIPLCRRKDPLTNTTADVKKDNECARATVTHGGSLGFSCIYRKQGKVGSCST